MAPSFDPARMTQFLELKRTWWLEAARRAREAKQLHLEAMALEVAGMYEDALQRVRQVEHRVEAQLRDLFWRHRLWQSNN
jgi:hypothetical protein